MEPFVRALLEEVWRLRGKLDAIRATANNVKVREDELREQVMDMCNVGLGSQAEFRLPQLTGGQDDE